jgi:effector-binding domain-containing protein
MGFAAARKAGMSEKRSAAMSDAQTDPEAVVFIEDREPQAVVSIRSIVAVAELAQAQSERLGELWRSMQARDLAPVGPPFVRYHTFGETDTDVELGVPVRKEATGEGRIEAGSLPGGAAIVTWHLGAHNSLGEGYGRLNAWLERQGRRAAGPAWEVYWWIDARREPDPSSWPEPAEWRTELVQPVARMEGQP